MADLNFPQNPAPGDTYSIGSRTWIWNGSGWALQSGIVSTNPFIVVSAQITTTTNSTSTTSGALVVAGGGGFGGNVYAADIYSNGSQVVTTGTIGSFGVSAVQAGTDTAVANLGGNVVLIWNTSTLQTVTSRGSSTNNAISITNTTASTGTSSGALTVAGGLGVAGNVNIGGELKGNYADGYVIVTTASGTLSTSTGLQFTGTDSRLTVGGSIFENNNRVLTSVTPTAGTAISITSVSTSNGNTAFTVNNTGVTSAAGTTYLGVSASTGDITFTNLGVQSLTGTTHLGVSTSTGTITITNLGVQTLTAGTGTSVSASTGQITVSSIDTLQSVTDRGATTDQVVRITNATGASTTTDGALVVTGGVGVGQNLWVGGTANIIGRTTFSNEVVFNGTATFVLSTNTVYTDNILELHTTSSNVAWTFDDVKDIGLRFRYFNRTLNTGTNAALVLSNNAQFLEWYSAGAEGDNVFTGTQYGIFRTGGIRLTSTDANIGTTASGALQVQGGVGIVGTEYIAGVGGVGSSNTVSQQSLLVGQGGVGVYGASHFANAVGIGGNLAVTGTSILTGSVSAGGNVSVGNDFTVTGVTRLIGAATASSTLGVRGNFNVTGTSILTGNVTATNNLSVGGNLAVTGTSVLTGITRIDNITNSADTASGALVVAGGGGFGGNLNVGGNIFVQGVINATVVGSIDTATNVTGGAAGAILVQTAFGRTSFINPGAAGTILTSNGTGQQPTYQNTLTLAGNTNASSTNTGALQVVGGIGIGRDAWIGGDLYVSGNQVVTTGTIGGLANLTVITAGTDTEVSTSTGNIVIWNTSTLASVTARSGITSTALRFENSTQSTSTDTGALVISGGLGIGKNVTIGQNLTVFGTINFQGQGGSAIDGNTATFGWVNVTGTQIGLFVSGSAVVGNNLTATTINVIGRSTLQDTTAATLTATNVTVTNNQTVNNNLSVGGNLYTTGTAHLIGNVYAGANVGIQGNLSTTGTTTLIGAATAESTLGVRGNFNVTGTSLLVGNSHIVGNLGVTGNVNVTGTTVLSTLTVTNTLNVGSTTTFAKSIIVGPASQYKSYESITTSTVDRLVIDVFDSTFYRTVKYLVSVADTGYTPNRVQVEEFLVFHDNNSTSTTVQIIQYAVGNNLGALGDFDAVHSAGEITIYFDPAFTPVNLTVKTVRTAVTV
jgi:fibronectin-binding autotransporter adhesin